MNQFTKIFNQLIEIAKRIHTNRWSLLPIFAAGMSIFLLVQSDKFAMLLTGVLVIAGATSVLKIQPQRLICFYFLYLMFEGAFKILTNYNPVVHVGSDVVLVVIFVRLIGRFGRESNTDLSPAVRARLDRVASFLFLFWVWVLAQFFNPWGLGFIPSIAGLKVHAIPMLMLFIVGYLLKDDELKTLPRLLLAMGLFEAILSLVDWTMGPTLIPSLHPRYASTVITFLQGFPYRPFGTTNLPGAPSIWMFHTLAGALILFHLTTTRDDSVARPKLWSRLFLLFLPLAFGTLIICQVRISVVRFLAAAFAGCFILGRRYVGYAFAALSLFPIALAFTPKAKFEDLVSIDKPGQTIRIQQALARIGTLGDGAAWTKSRGGNWVMQALSSRARITLSGVGLSRFGAAASPWTELIKRDPYFNADWTFSDNVFLALFTELGIGGLAAYLLLVSAVIWHLLHIPSPIAKIAATACSIIVLSGFASEGILFQPDASFFWFFAAIGLRSPERRVEA